MAKDNIIQSVDRALKILEVLSTRKEGYGVTELSHILPLNKTSVYRMLSTLVLHGFVEQDLETERYKLGYKVLELSSILLDSIDLRMEAKAYLKEVERLTNEVVHLVVYDRGEAVYIEKLEGNETLRMHSKVGSRAPMHCSGVGKVILAHLPEQEAVQIIERYGMAAHTAHTITDRELLFDHLRMIRKKGYALDLEENELGINCIAGPIFDHSGRVVAAVSISGPTMRMTKERIDQLKDGIIAVSKKISKRLGWRGDHIPQQ
ncbi:IclR family transcriptional regulator [Kroppenstedtia eburnea]|uniref:Glycerol operon regulatory protein n=1 Tax=Kroppenstedtia eburnea TaxID=714067 RepID=A0A1N7IYU8_9BACL|nr:IclR family transcriptional regulator [Kroppenstedtia eburnea]QKI82341.1 IclR family transcriptional regulator [Kroppenstedtia eburnea]SIS42275.1 transcriptional regulator, IclR family [Kroppenstedtia eburnea]